MTRKYGYGQWFNGQALKEAIKEQQPPMINDDLHAGIIDWQDMTEEDARAINEHMSDPDYPLDLYQEAILAQEQYEHDHPELYPPTSMSDLDIDFSDQQEDQS